MRDRRKRLIIVPRNGYINRIQAIASASILAEDLNFELKIYWDTEPNWATDYYSLFDEKFYSNKFVNKKYVDEALNYKNLFQLPNYLNVSRDGGFISLIGADKDEQRFICELVNLLNINQEINTILIVAGAKFYIGDPDEFILRRADFYNSIIWNSRISNNYLLNLFLEAEYVGIHIRRTDRFLSAPSTNQILKELKVMRSKTNLNTVFIACDNKRDREKWCKILRGLNLDVIDLDIQEFDRKEVSTGIFAIPDWIMLSRSVCIIYHGHSSFSQEASILNKRSDYSKGLVATSPVLYMRYIFCGYIFELIYFKLLKILSRLKLFFFN
jgi:hypothetical protein